MSGAKKPHSTQTSTPVMPAEPARLQPLNWSYPFEARDGKSMDAHTWLKALGVSQSGFYPLGANGMWHGGIHFDQATGGALKQGDGVRAIADGEVIAYRLDSKYPELKYNDRRMALYSTGFVLLRHKLILPSAPNQSTSSAAKSADAASASTPSADPASAPYSPPADDVLEFFSLYMHQLDWAGFRAAEQDVDHTTRGTAQTKGDSIATSSQNSAAATIRRMPYWKGDQRFIVGAKATTTQQLPAPSKVPYRFDQIPNQPDLEAAAISGVMLSDGLGVPVELASSTVDQADPYLQHVRISAPPIDPVELNAAKPAQGIQIKDRANGDLIGLLPRGGEITIVGNATSGWAQIGKITKGAPVPFKVDGQMDPRATTGWVRVEELDVLIDPNPLDAVIVLERPFAVKAGDVVGYLGEYQRYSESQLLPPKPSRPMIHVEVFAGDSFKRFVERSRERAKSLKAQGSLLLIRNGAKLVVPAGTELSIPDGQFLKLAKSDPGKGNWAKVQPTKASTEPVNKTDKKHKTSGGVAIGPEVWVERVHSGKASDGSIRAWSKFPLQLANADSPQAAFEQVISRAALEDGQDASALDDVGVHWWNIAVGDASGRTSWGWVCEKDHPKAEWQSAWSWPGFELVDSSSIAPVDMFKRFLFVSGQIFDGEAEEFRAVAASINAGELIGRLEKAVDLQGDGDGKVTSNELRKALGVRWLASTLSHIAVRYESEWGGSLSKWDALSALMGSGRYVWQGELERIQKLRWWDSVSGVVKGFPAEPIVWHLHPIGVVGNFANAAAGTLTIEEARVRAFLRMIRVGEGTESPAGYERLFGGESFITNYHRDFSDHPHIKITKTSHGRSITSSAAGAYQVMGYNWDDPAYVNYRKKFGISDFSPISQDRYCVILIKFKRNALDAVKNGEASKAVFDHRCNLEWASLPGNSYGQGDVSIDTVTKKFTEYLNDELAGRTDLAVPGHGLDDLLR